MFELIRSNKIKSIVLIILMNMILIGLGAAIGLYLLPADPADGLFYGIAIAAIIWIVMVLSSVMGGEQILLATAGAKEISHGSSPQLFNVVDEMRIASGLPAMPKIYIIDSSVPNAFAVGLNPKRAAVAVTTGLLTKLNRDELQGVIAHEISHVVNRDTLFMTIAGVSMGAIILIADLFARGAWYSSGSRRRSSGGGQLAVVIMVLSLLLAILAPILAQILYFACSRRREYCADAGSAQFTRYPEGLASALEKISDAQSNQLSDSRVLAPMFIVNPLAARGSSAGLFSTHPSTEDRIRILRTMAHSASLNGYESAYRKLHGNQSLIGTRSLQAADDQPIREPQPDEIAPAPVETRRQAQNIVHSANGLGTIGCSCGLIMRIPQNFKEQSLKCPRCGKEHSLAGN